VGKEAVFKSLMVPSKGAAAAMKDIEILPDETGAPCVILRTGYLGASNPFQVDCLMGTARPFDLWEGGEST
jgi:phosphopantetheinyl transferase (holo-ACP synthase)